MKKVLVLVLLLAGGGAILPASAQVQITLSALRALLSPSTTQPYLITDPGREGFFYYDPADRSSADNGGTVLVAGNLRFKRMYHGPIDARWFGMKGDYNGSGGTDNTNALRAAIAAAGNGQTVLVPHGNYYISGSISLPLANERKVNLEIHGNIYFARGSGFVIEGANQYFKSHGLIAGLNSGASSESAYAAYQGTGLLLRNAVNCQIEVNEIKDFKYGIHLTADNASGTAAGCQYNKIHFNSIHHNYVQIRVSVGGSTSGAGNWNNATFWYGGQLGRGIPNVTYGQGGWFGVVFVKESGSNAKFAMEGHVFHNVAFEGLEKGLVMSHASSNSFIGGRIEPDGVRTAFNLDPATCAENRFIGIAHITESQFEDGRLGKNTTITGTPVWIGDENSKGLGGLQATNSVDPSKLLITTNAYSSTNFQTNKKNDLISQTGQYPTVQAMMYRIDGVTRSVPYKQTFFHVKAGQGESTMKLPPNIGLVRVEADQAKTLQVDPGDLAIYGEGFIVEYLSPRFPLRFVRADNGAELIPASKFPGAGTYRCVWVDAQFKVSRIGDEYETATFVGATHTPGPGVRTVFGNSTHNPAIVQLPDAANWPGREITIKNIQMAKPIQVNGIAPGDENILQGRGSMTVKSDGTQWHVIHLYKRPPVF